MRAHRRTNGADSGVAGVFVRQLCLQRPHTSSTYLHILEGFDRFVAVHSSSELLSVEVIQNWLVTARVHGRFLFWSTTRV